jgi:hypothetical protein
MRRARTEDISDGWRGSPIRSGAPVALGDAAVCKIAVCARAGLIESGRILGRIQVSTDRRAEQDEEQPKPRRWRQGDVYRIGMRTMPPTVINRGRQLEEVERTAPKALEEMAD